ncbi:MAG: conserved protein, permease-related protein [Fusobacteriia bacterium 4572_132]|nr:MAG: conserved protein, permease-related protein [Fusobacteriia bacterium 4572_132]
MIYGITAILLIVLYFKDKEKTIKSVKLGAKKLFKQLPIFFNMMTLVAISLYFVTDEMIVQYLGTGTSGLGMMIGAFFGSIAIMPGFIAFPLAGLLLEKGVTYMVLASFTNTLMMVGIVSFPVEKEYFGVKVAVIRNVVGFMTAIIVALIIGLLYGELV